MTLSATATQAGQRERNTFLDAVRSVAILRVVVWHTYGFAWISYFVASMPAMFFLAGSLMAYSLRRGDYLGVLVNRFRRLLIPFWLVGIAAVSVMLVYDRSVDSAAATFHLKDFAGWIFPVFDPSGSEWGLTWWAPLWYLRCLAWLLLASPLLLLLWRRLGPGLILLPLVGLTIAEQRLNNGYNVPWQLQDAALYSFFWLLGFAHNDGLFARLTTPMRASFCAIFAALSAWWAVSQDVPDGVVNASYPLHLFVGLAWLFGALTFERWIARAAAMPRVADVLYWVNERALTIYLWQAVGLFVMYQILWAEPQSALTRDVLALPIVASVTFLAVVLFGWLEDVAARRRPRLWPARSSSQRQPGVAGAARPARLNVRLALPSAGVAAIGLAALFVAGSNIIKEPSAVVQASRQTVPPSGVGLHFRAQQAEITGIPATRPLSGKAGPVSVEELQSEIEAWLVEWQISGVTTTLQRYTGESWTGAAGRHDTDAPFVPYEPYAIASVTKTFTAALILQLADEKKLSLNDKASKYVPIIPYADRFTIKQLLQHTSGLVPGDDLPYKALADSAAEGLQFQPGKGYLYSRTGYYILGLIIERVTGRPFAQTLREQILEPQELSSTFMDEDILALPYSTHPYEVENVGYEGVLWTSGANLRDQIGPRFAYHGYLWSAGGLWSNTSNLARWALALWDGDKVISRASREQMTTFLGASFDYTGLGTYPFCPCWQEKSQLKAERWGFVGVTGSLEYDPVDRLALAVRMSGTILDENVLDALEDFSVRMRRLVRQRPLPGE